MNILLLKTFGSFIYIYELYGVNQSPVMLWPEDERIKTWSILRPDAEKCVRFPLEDADTILSHSALIWQFIKKLFLASLSHLWKIDLSSRTSQCSGIICTTASSWPLTPWHLSTLLPQSGFLSVFSSPYCRSESHFPLFKILWRLSRSVFSFVRALVVSFDLALPLRRPVSHVCASLQQGASEITIIFSLWTFIMVHRTFSVFVSGMRKAKHEKPLKSQPNIKGMMSHRCSFWMAIYKEGCMETFKSMKMA